MYLIVSYDIKSDKNIKVMKTLRKYLFHTHYSVFEGELTDKEFDNMKYEINKCINKEIDSIIYYIIATPKALNKQGINFNDELIVV